ncbi:MAG: sigma-70 family RNA polymerase sigma factor [Thioalkalispiraceae bacterium]|jgi:RNA polymerase sigma-70 factor (ECF subfamily)
MAKISEDNIRTFQNTILIHLDAAFNYARWLSRNKQDAEDLTQEACMRAYASFNKFEHKNSKSWLLTIIRNTFLNQYQKEKRQAEVIYLDSPTFINSLPEALQDTDTPENKLLRDREARVIYSAINDLDVEFREIIVLREIEGLSYKEISVITGCAMGTVMSRLSRARNHLKTILRPDPKFKEDEA